MSNIFPDCLVINDSKLKACISSLIEAVNEFWERPLHHHYTNHGVDHSERILNILENLIKPYQISLNLYERFILVSAAYLHDIGMQSAFQSGLEDKFVYTENELELIRANHHELSAEIIVDSVSKKSELFLGLYMCRAYVHMIAEVVSYHRILNLNNIEDTSFAGHTIRLKLLATLLRLADNLDADFRRVNMTVLKQRWIPPISKYHWWFHYYTQSVSIEEGRIELFLRFPMDYKDVKLLAIFRKKIVNNIQSVLDEVLEILHHYELDFKPKILIREEIRMKSGSLELIPKDLESFIHEKVLSTIDLTEDASKNTNLDWYTNVIPYSDNIEIINYLKLIFECINSGKVKNAISILEECRIIEMKAINRITLLAISSNCYYFIGNAILAENSCKDIMKYSEKKDLQEIYGTELKISVSVALNILGLINMISCKFKEAINLFEQALTIDREIKNTFGEINRLVNLSIVYSEVNNFSKARGLLEDVLNLSKNSKNEIGETTALINLGIIHKEIKEYDIAIKKYKEAEKIAKEAQFKLGEATALINLGITCHNIKSLILL